MEAKKTGGFIGGQTVRSRKNQPSPAVTDTLAVTMNPALDVSTATVKVVDWPKKRPPFQNFWRHKVEQGNEIAVQPQRVVLSTRSQCKAEIDRQALLPMAGLAGCLDGQDSESFRAVENGGRNPFKP